MDIIIKNALIIINNIATNIKFYFDKNNKLTKLKYTISHFYFAKMKL